MSPRKAVTPENRKPYSNKEISVFAINFQARRINLGFSQAAVGKLLGIPSSRISEIEGGKFPNDPNRIVAIADALEISLDELFGRKPLSFELPSAGDRMADDYLPKTAKEEKAWKKKILKKVSPFSLLSRAIRRNDMVMIRKAFAKYYESEFPDARTPGYDPLATDDATDAAAEDDDE